MRSFRSLVKGPDLSDLCTLPDESLHLTHNEIKQLRQSWSELRNLNVGQLMFREIFSRCPEVTNLFRLDGLSIEQASISPTIIQQALIIEDTIEMVIDDLSHGNDGLRNALRQLGEHHSHFCRGKMRQDHWPLLGNALLAVIGSCTQATPSSSRLAQWRLRRLWRRLVYFVLSALLAGFKQFRKESAIAQVRKCLMTGSRRW